MPPVGHSSNAIVLATPFPGKGALTIQKDELVAVRTDGQVYGYHFPALTVPAGGMLTLYLGTDGNCYYDAALKHMAHSGACASGTKGHAQ